MLALQNGFNKQSTNNGNDVLMKVGLNVQFIYMWLGNYILITYFVVKVVKS